MSTSPGARVLDGLLRRLPFVGYVMRLIEGQKFRELALFGANAAATLALSIATFGFPLFIIIMYCAVGLAALSILIATRG